MNKQANGCAAVDAELRASKDAQWVMNYLFAQSPAHAPTETMRDYVASVAQLRADRDALMESLKDMLYQAGLNVTGTESHLRATELIARIEGRA
jgi:hypothetical protein